MLQHWNTRNVDKFIHAGTFYPLELAEKTGEHLCQLAYCALECALSTNVNYWADFTNALGTKRKCSSVWTQHF